MEHREPPRIGTGGRSSAAVENVAGRARLRAFDPFRGRPRVDPLRLGITALGVIVVGALVVYGLSRATSSAVAWLHRQPQYRLAFTDIELAQELPRWYRGGKKEFLTRVQRSSGNAETVSLLEVKPERIATAFRLEPWVEEVNRVTFRPGRILVDVKFREPVAWVKVGAGHQILDGEGRLLPSDDVDLALAGPLIQITGEDLTAPAETRAGVVWKSKPAGSDEGQVDERIVAASSLARFLAERARSDPAASSKSLRMVEIIITAFAKQGLFIVNSEKTIFHWGGAPGAEGLREPAADEKWQILLRWNSLPIDHTLPKAEDDRFNDYFDFTPRGLAHRCPHKPSHPERATTQ